MFNQDALNQDVSKTPSRRIGRLTALSLALALAATVLALQPARAVASMTVDVTANPTTLKAPGGTVTFNVVVTNTGTEPLTISSLTDSVYGDISDDGTCTTAVGTVLQPTDTYSCSYTASVSGVAGASQADIVVAKATDAQATEYSATDTAVVVITPRLSITKTANPTTLPPGGGSVTFSISVVNLGSDSITITALTDSDFGDLATRGTCTNAVGTVLISEASSYSCSFTATISANHANTATVTASGSGGPFVATDDATVTIVAPTTTTTSTTKPAAASVTSTTLSSSTAGLVLTLSQSSGLRDERFNISGSGWAVNEIVTLTFNSHTRVFGTVVVDSGGRFSLNVRVPDDAEVGGHTITATGQAGRAVSRPFTVNAGTLTTLAGDASGTGTTIRSGTLARTGMSTGDLALLAVMAMMLGAAATAASPRGRLAWSTRRDARRN